MPNTTRTLKYLLIASLCIIIMAIIFIYQSQNHKLTLHSSADLNMRENSKFKEYLPKTNTVVEPKLYGLDDNGNPFSITAAYATQKGDVINMEKITCNVHLSKDVSIKLCADAGSVYLNDKKLSLSNNVVIQTEAGEEMHTEYVDVMYAESKAYSNKPLSIKTEFVSVGASGFSITFLNQMKLIKFSGPVKTTIKYNAGDYLD